jgi:hypothetical protein
VDDLFTVPGEAIGASRCVGDVVRLLHRQASSLTAGA